MTEKLEELRKKIEDGEAKLRAASDELGTLRAEELKEQQAEEELKQKKKEDECIREAQKERKKQERKDAAKRKARELETMERLVKEKKKGTVFHARLPAMFLQKIFTAIKFVAFNECKLSLKQSGMGHRSVDPAHVEMLDIMMPKSMFEEYELTGELDIGIQMDEILTVLKSIEKTKKPVAQVGLDMYENDDRNLYVSWKVVSGRMERKIHLIDTAALPDSTMPNLTLPASFELFVKDVLKFMKNASKVSDHISVAAMKKGVLLTAEGDEDDVNYVPMNIETTNIPEYCRSLFSSDYFESMLKSLQMFFKTVIINMSTDNPIKMSGKTTEEMPLVMALLVAPRIESE